MQITLDFLRKKGACSEGIIFFENEFNAETDIISTDITSLVNRIKEKKAELLWAAWVLTKALTKRNCVKLAIFSAKEVLPIWKKQYPNDKRPEEAIKAAENRKISHANAMNAAAAAAYAAADAAAAAAYAAAYAAAAAAADDTAAAADDTAAAAADAAAAAYTYDKNTTLTKIINYGLTLIKEQEEINNEKNKS